MEHLDHLPGRESPDHERLDALVAEVRRLPDRYSVPVSLHYLADLPYRDVAEVGRRARSPSGAHSKGGRRHASPAGRPGSQDEEATCPAGSDPVGPALSPRPAVPPLELVLSRDVKETQSRIEYNGRELGRDDKGLDVIAGSFRKGVPKEPGKLTVRLEAFSSVPCRQVVRALDLLREVGFGSIELSLDAPSLLMFRVNLFLTDGKVGLSHERRESSLPLAEGLKSLQWELDQFKARGRKPRGLIDAGLYIPQDAVKQVQELFRKAGFGDCVRIT